VPINENGPAGASNTPGPGPQKGLETVDTTKDNAPGPHPPTDQDRDQAPHACLSGLVFIGHLACDPETGEEVEEIWAIPCRRCNDDEL
jgi:hypothetical protein